MRRVKFIQDPDTNLIALYVLSEGDQPVAHLSPSEAIDMAEALEELCERILEERR